MQEPKCFECPLLDSEVELVARTQDLGLYCVVREARDVRAVHEEDHVSGRESCFPRDAVFAHLQPQNSYVLEGVFEAKESRRFTINLCLTTKGMFVPSGRAPACVGRRLPQERSPRAFRYWFGGAEPAL